MFRANVDARHKAGHDGLCQPSLILLVAFSVRL
jgi:hypothetical protein